ncbi:MAG: ABC transporter ATP-binding protein [Nitrososphaerota archaeon]|nr:ABC transporter ATP-binding protein [Nitrososphaerota archaeon]MDG6938967.1 ABC transporter ATP-binding protein [Nitrososphaerota archaeon]
MFACSLPCIWDVYFLLGISLVCLSRSAFKKFKEWVPDDTPLSAQAVEAEGLVKRYETTYALSGLSFIVKPGEIYGLLGPNGSGKTTTIKIISALLQPTAGKIRVLGLDPGTDPVAVKAKIGYVPENPTLYDSLSPREFFEFVVSVRRLDDEAAGARVARLVDAFDMGEYYDSPISALSMGTKQKVTIIASLIHEPRLLLMDEPLNGLDAKSSRILKEIMLYHTERGGSVLFSTHIMEVAENVCHRIGIIYQGKIMAEGNMAELRDLAGRQGATLEEVFLKLTHEESEVRDTVRTLREAFGAAP